MSASFFFYDLETSGVNPRDARIMQFAGQRTDMDLQPIGEPVNVLIKMTDDVVPEPDAILVTCITPQQTIQDGISEVDFLKLFFDEVATPDTIFVGFNSVRFDDEFMRYLLYRNFYDPYEWQYAEGRSRWDLLDVVRMTRALRPDGIKWPTDSDGKATNRLELLSKANGLDHAAAHDALSDVQALIGLAKLIKTNQPKIFDYLLELRDKRKVAALAQSNAPFIYTSGKYPSEFEKTTVVAAISGHPKRQGAIVFDLRHDPRPYAEMSAPELAKALQYGPKEGERPPIKTLQFNRCPAVAPLSVLDATSQKRLQLDMKTIQQNFEYLQALPKLKETVLKAISLLDDAQAERFIDRDGDVDTKLYDGFYDTPDKTKMSALRAATQDELMNFEVTFKDQRLEALLPLYKARNFPKTLSENEREVWEQFRHRRLLGGKEHSRLAKFFARLGELAQQSRISPQKQYLLEELQLYGQSIMPVDAEF